MSVRTDGEQIRRLLAVCRTLMSEHDTESVLERILTEARAVTGARYAALGVLDEDRDELERFVTAGIDPAAVHAIGDLPKGRGVLGVLIEDPRPLRLAEVGNHPQSYGFPIGHPPMQSFLGVPIVIRGEAWGNLYLTEKDGGSPFTEDDEEAVVVLAQWAATAIDNARLYEESERRRLQLERAVRSLEAARDIADAISGASDLERIFELIVKRGRALIGARTVLIMLRDGDELVIVASAGHEAGATGRRLPISCSTSGEVLERGRARRITDATSELTVAPGELGLPNAHSALLVPMASRGNRVGVLAAFDRGPAGEPFSSEDEQLLRTFAASAANAVAVSRGVEADRLRSTIAAADAERGRWARELHDQTLQSLGALRVALASMLGRGDADTKDAAIRQAIEDIELEIDNLRGIITDLRPSMLDDLGLLPALRALLERRGGDLQITSDISLPAEASLPAALETTIYRLVQEALTNIIKHARASAVRVAVELSERSVIVEVQDDGMGFDADARTSGFGLAGMRERVYLAAGTIAFEPMEPGMLVRARLPLPSEADTASLGSYQAAS